MAVWRQVWGEECVDILDEEGPRLLADWAEQPVEGVPDMRREPWLRNAGICHSL